MKTKLGVLNTAKIKLKYVFGLAVAMVIGGATTAVVLAAIPDSGGVVHGCYKTATGLLRVVDSDAGAMCQSGETMLNWNQTGPQGPAGATGATGATGPAGADGASADPVAYADITLDNLSQAHFVTPTHSKNIVTVYHPTAGYPDFPDQLCIKVSFTPHFVALSPGQVIIRGETTNGDSQIDQVCGTDFNVFLNEDASGSYLFF